jgi:Zn-dependent protease with chaperone function
MTPLARTVWTGYYYDARHAERHPVTITVATDGLHIRGEDGSVRWWSYQDLHQTQGFYPGEHVRFEKSDELSEALVVPETDFLEAIRQIAPEIGSQFGRPDRQWFRLRLAIITGAGILLTLGGMYFWGIPGLADLAASRVPVSWEEKLGAEVLAQVAPANLRCEERGRLQSLEGIITRLISAQEAAPYQIRLTVVNQDAVNALAAPGGYVVVYRGLLEKTATPEELAGVLAHEIEHVRQRHGTKAIFRQLSMGVLLSLLAGDSSGLGSALHAAGTLGTLRYSRRYEEEADRGGMILIQRAHIDANGMLRFLESLEKESGTAPGVLAYLSTHPPTEERLERLRQLSREADYTPRPLLSEQSWREVAGICGAGAGS